ncbi:MAG: CbtB domain-containing protein [Methylococcaceae bacterium]|jgi:cobalt transporter subunit CbtB
MSVIPSITENLETQPRSASLKDSVLSSLLLAVFALIILYGAGFAEATQLHNAAHDGRHSAGFPCH